MRLRPRISALWRVSFVWIAGLVAGACASDSSVSPTSIRKITLSAPKPVVEVGEPVTIAAFARDARDSLVSGASLQWSAEPAAVATVNNGIVTTLAPGTVVLTASSGTARASLTLDVIRPRAATVQLSASTTTLAPQQTIAASANARDARQRSLPAAALVWRSTDVRVASVTDQGVITAITPGLAYIVVRADSARDSLPIQVTAPVSLFIAPDDIDLPLNGSRTLAARYRAADGVISVAGGAVWSSSEPQVVTVVGGTVTGIAPGVARLTAVAGTLTATATVRVAQRYGDYIVSTPTTGVQGVIRADNMRISHLTANGPLTLIASGDIEISNTVKAPCFPITILAGGRLLISRPVYGGDADALGNECRNSAPPDELPGIRIEARGGFRLNNAPIRSSGDITITNDPRLVSDDFSGLQVDRVDQACALYTVFIDQRFLPSNALPTYHGRRGPHIDISCRGNLSMVNTTMYVRGGSNGATVTHPSFAVGGNGGNAGTIRMRATGDVLIGGEALTLSLGQSGAGGDANAVATGSTGASATGIGGNAGDVGTPTQPPIELRAAGIVSHGNIRDGTVMMRVTVGHAGRGGAAFATGGAGPDATAMAPAGVGGKATALGGRGGRVYPPVLPTSVTFSAAALVVNGFSGGHGGDATAAAGVGGTGSAAFPNGGPGGGAHAIGGDGSSTSMVTNGLTAIGGDAGAAILTGGSGGRGFDRCDPVGPGGIGGVGGVLSGAAGRPGSGMLAGKPALIDIWSAGRGGDGGKGSAPGRGGSKGVDESSALGPRAVDALSLVNGTDGTGC